MAGGDVVACASGCGRSFTLAPRSTRRFCVVCRPPRARGKAGPAPAQAVVTAQAVPEEPAEPEPGMMERAVLAELRQFGREGSVAGVGAILAARSVDNGLNTGSQISVLVDRVFKSVALAIGGAAPVGDAVDELQRARQARHAAMAAAHAAQMIAASS